MKGNLIFNLILLLMIVILLISFITETSKHAEQLREMKKELERQVKQENEIRLYLCRLKRELYQQREWAKEQIERRASDE